MAAERSWTSESLDLLLKINKSWFTCKNCTVFTALTCLVLTWLCLWFIQMCPWWRWWWWWCFLPFGVTLLLISAHDCKNLLPPSLDMTRLIFSLTQLGLGILNCVGLVIGSSFFKRCHYDAYCGGTCPWRHVSWSWQCESGSLWTGWC